MSADLPPEAYTHKTLQAAFDWLQTQPEGLRTAIHTPERLVSLYKKSQRLNDGDHPVSSKKFISDLKSLAGPLAQFAENPQTDAVLAPPTAPQAALATPSHSPLPTTPLSDSETNPKASRETASRTQQDQANVFSSEATSTAQQHQPNASPFGHARLLDSVTEQRLAEVQSRFNLSSSDEALRMLVSLGYEKFIKFD